jgi:hypothetical protein
MELSFDEYELIDRYLDGKLQGQELDAFVKRMEREQSFADKVSLQKTTNNLLLENGLYDLREKLDSYKPPTSFNFKTFLFITAIVCILSTMAILMIKKHDDSPSKENQSEVSKPMDVQETFQDSPSDGLTENQKQNLLKRETKEAENQNPVVSKKQDSAVSVNENPKDQVSIHVKSKDSLQEETKILPKIKVCDQVTILYDFQIFPSCENEMNGRIQFNTLQTKGGKAPYKYSIDAGKSYQTSSLFSDLAPESYSLVLKDANGCESKEKVAIVKTKSCLKEKAYMINPEAGEAWPVPKGYLNCNLYIYDRNGREVFLVNLHAGHQEDWNGTSSQGKDLEMGQYAYTVTCGTETKEKGYITIVR